MHISLGLTLLLTLASCGLSKTQENDTTSLDSQQEAAVNQVADEPTENMEASMSEMEKEIDEVIDEMKAEKLLDVDTGADVSIIEEEKWKAEKMVDDTSEMTETKQPAWMYTAYSDDMLGKTDNTVVFFHAAWCPSCRAADSWISAGEVQAGLTILKADYDNSTDLKKKYGVVAQHTFVQVDAEGNMVKKWLGGTDIASIEKNLK